MAQVHEATVQHPEARRVYIAYAKEDRRSAVELASTLQGAGIEARLDHDDLSPGDALDVAMAEEVASADAVLVLLSRHAARSPSVAMEASFALDLQTERGRPLVLPVRLDRRAEVPIWIRDRQVLELWQMRTRDDARDALVNAVERPRPMHTTDSPPVDQQSYEGSYGRAMESSMRAQALTSRVRATALVALIVSVAAVLTGAVLVPQLRDAGGVNTVALLTGFSGTVLGYYFGSRGRLL